MTESSDVLIRIKLYGPSDYFCSTVLLRNPAKIKQKRVSYISAFCCSVESQIENNTGILHLYVAAVGVNLNFGYGTQLVLSLTVLFYSNCCFSAITPSGLGRIFKSALREQLCGCWMLYWSPRKYLPHLTWNN